MFKKNIEAYLRRHGIWAYLALNNFNSTVGVTING